MMVSHTRHNACTGFHGPWHFSWHPSLPVPMTSDGIDRMSVNKQILADEIEELSYAEDYCESCRVSVLVSDRIARRCGQYG